MIPHDSWPEKWFSAAAHPLSILSLIKEMGCLCVSLLPPIGQVNDRRRLKIGVIVPWATGNNVG